MLQGLAEDLSGRRENIIFSQISNVTNAIALLGSKTRDRYHATNAQDATEKPLNDSKFKSAIKLNQIEKENIIPSVLHVDKEKLSTPRHFVPLSPERESKHLPRRKTHLQNMPGMPTSTSRVPTASISRCWNSLTIRQKGIPPMQSAVLISRGCSKNFLM